MSFSEFMKKVESELGNNGYSIVIHIVQEDGCDLHRIVFLGKEFEFNLDVYLETYYNTFISNKSTLKEIFTNIEKRYCAYENSLKLGKVNK